MVINRILGMDPMKRYSNDDLKKISLAAIASFIRRERKAFMGPGGYAAPAERRSRGEKRFSRMKGNWLNGREMKP
jgi:hypothetical protein